MGKRITVYLNEYYYNLFKNLKNKIRDDKNIDINNTDLIKLSLLALKEKILNNEED